ncbi:MAG: hypothetical protein ACYCYP_10695 [Leptospirales bacterium]
MDLLFFVLLKRQYVHVVGPHDFVSVPDTITSGTLIEALESLVEEGVTGNCKIPSQ